MLSFNVAGRSGTELCFLALGREKMTMTISSSQRIISRSAVGCPVCDAPDGHYEDCPSLEIDELRRRQHHIECPKCGRRAVDRNDHDYYECRACHTQYTTGRVADSPKAEMISLVVDLDAPIEEGIVSVYVLKRKGGGDFSIDKRVKELQDEIRKMCGRKKRGEGKK